MISSVHLQLLEFGELPKAVELVGDRAWLWNPHKMPASKANPCALNPTTALERGGSSHMVPWRPDGVRSAGTYEPTPSPMDLRMLLSPSPNSTLIIFMKHQNLTRKPQNSWCSRNQHTCCQTSHWFHGPREHSDPTAHRPGNYMLWTTVPTCVLSFPPCFLSPGTFPVISGKLSLFMGTASILIFKRMLY